MVQPLPQSVPASASLQSLLWKSASLYALFLIPSVLLCLYYGASDASLSTHMGGTWQGWVWQFPGLSSLGTRVLLDSLETMAIGGLAWFFYSGYRVLAQQTPQASSPEPALARVVLGWAALCGGLLIFSTPFHSSDIFGYLNRGFQQSVFHTNPYLTPIAEIPHWFKSPLLHAHWIDNPCPYGFWFARLTDWVTQLSGPHFTLAYLAFKGLHWLLLVAITGLLVKISQQLGHQRPWLNAYLWGANPLVLLHAVGNGHNDLIMVFLLLLSLWVTLRPGWRWLSLPLATLSVLTKYASLLAIPFLALSLIRKKASSALWWGGLLSVLILIALSLSYIEPSHPWPWKDMLDNAGKPQHSIISLLSASLYYPLKWLHGPAKAVETQFLAYVKPIFWASFVGFYGWRFWKGWQSNPYTHPALIEDVALLSTVMISLISAKFHPWYPVMFLPLCLLLPIANPLRRFALIFSLFQLAGFTILQNLPIASELALTVLPLSMAYFKRPKWPLFEESVTTA